MLAIAFCTKPGPTDRNPTPLGAGITMPMVAANRSIR
jgi:hypothetical protein